MTKQATAVAPPAWPKYLIREPWGDYFAKAKDNVSSHSLGQFRRSPAYYRRMQLGLATQHDTDWFHIGRALGKLALEGREEYQREYAVGGPINPKTGKPFGSGTKAFDEWAKEQGRPVLSEDDGLLIEMMAAQIIAHPVAATLLKSGFPEGVVRQNYLGIPCQSRLDWLKPGVGVVDLKSTRDIDCFEQQVRDYGYMNQLAFYREMVRLASGEELNCYLIAVEKVEPYRVGVWTFSRVALFQAQVENEKALTELAMCRDHEDWPTGYEQMRTIEA